MNYKQTVKINDNISLPYIWYQVRNGLILSEDLQHLGEPTLFYKLQSVV